MGKRLLLMTFSLLLLYNEFNYAYPAIEDERGEDDTGKVTSFESTEIQCPAVQQKNADDWEFYVPPGESRSKGIHANASNFPEGITYLDMDDGEPGTTPYDTEDMRVQESEPEVDTEYLQSEWRQNWGRKNDEEKFEEVLQHAKYDTLVNWYRYGLQQWNELEQLKKSVAKKECDPSKLHEPIEAAEKRINKALKVIAKYMAKFQYGEATGEKTM